MTLSNVYSFVATATNYTNFDISAADISFTNLCALHGTEYTCSLRGRRARIHRLQP